MKTYYFTTPEGLDIVVELKEQFIEAGYQRRKWEISIEPPPKFKFGRPYADVLSDGSIKVELTAECELER